MSGVVERPAPGAAGFYERYLASADWRRSEARLRELSLAAHRCRLCGRGSPETVLEVHHRSYERLGQELASDLCTLCRECHGLVTAELRRRRYAARPVPPPRDTPRNSPTVPFGDASSDAGAPPHA